MIKEIKKIFSLLLISTFCFAGCTNSSDFYVQGIVELESQQKEKAVKNFEKAIKKGSSVEVLLSLRKLKELNIDSHKMLKLTTIVINSKKNPQAETYNYYVQSLVDNQKYEKVIKLIPTLLAQNSNVKKDWLKYCYVVSLAKKNKTVNNPIILNWIKQEKFSKYHLTFFEEFASDRFFYETEDGKKINLIFQFRTDLFNKKYNHALEKFTEMILSLDDIINLSPQMISEIGKSFLYGNFEIVKINYLIESKNQLAQSLKNIADNYSNTKNLTENIFVKKEKLFYLYFYAGRIFDKTNSTYYKNAKECFLLSARNSINDENYDNAIWYYLNQSKKESFASLMNEIKLYGNSWKDKSYYSDLLEELKLHLISTRQWTAFCNFYTTIEQVASEEIKSAWAYLTARLIKTDYANLQEIIEDEFLEKLFFDVLENSESSLYYKIMSAKNLNLDSKKIIDYMYFNFNQENLNVKDEQISKSVFNILTSCIKYKQISTFYEIVKQYKDYLSSDILSDFTKEIYKNFSDDENFYPTILRLASTAFSLCGNGKDLELLQILYPKYFSNLISESCKEYVLDEFILYGLIRTESYFDKDIFSVAGASGLTQLMKSTASDIARKLRIKEFDLLDAKTNITFGSFYLNELIRRLDGSILKAIISYNTGITRVRRWASQFANVPTDIWIEMFPYQESRDYGKKVLANSFVYGLLYYNKTSYEVVDLFMQ